MPFARLLRYKCATVTVSTIAVLMTGLSAGVATPAASAAGQVEMRSLLHVFSPVADHPSNSRSRSTWQMA